MGSMQANRSSPGDVVREVRGDKFVVTLRSGAGASVTFTGTISAANPTPVLNEFVTLVHAHVTQAQVKTVVVDLRPLEFMNSSGFKSFIFWLEKIEGLPEDQRYCLEFHRDPARRWQVTSLLALSCFSPSQVRVV